MPQKQKLHIPLTEKLKSVPEIFGIRMNEEPSYERIRKDGEVELRRYTTQIQAKVTLPAGDYDEFRERAFETLASYIFGGNRPKRTTAGEENIAMTSPVLVAKNTKHSWTMAFILPSKYKRSQAPQPKDPAVHIEEVKPFDAAVVSYSGNNTLEKNRAHEKILATWLAGQPTVRSDGQFIYAQYDAPFVIPFFKRNEVLLRIERIQ